jgi:membrane-associated protease RseP (regulator of RpoE activity)
MTARYSISAALIAAMACAGPAAAQRIGQACDGGRGRVVADLGFDQLGGSIGVSQHNDQRPVWEFGGEPVIGEVRGNGPAAGRLRDGDAIVAIDGQLITTEQGGRRYSAIDPGDQVRLSIRRAGRVQDVTVRAGSRCQRRPTPPTPPRAPAPPRPPRAGTPAAPGAPPAPPRPPASVRAPAPPRPPAPGREQTPPRPPQPPRAPVPGRPPTPPTPPTPPAPPEIMPDGWFGFGIQCNNCGIHATQGRQAVFQFREQPSVVNVEPGTPAARAGMRRGDRLTHVDGIAITTQPGWTRFGAIQPGQQVRWTFTRDGRAHEATMTALRRPDAGRAPTPPASPTAQRLRYSGSAGGAQVEVRGAPVNVTTDPRTGEMIIRSADLTVRIRPDRP